MNDSPTQLPDDLMDASEAAAVLKVSKHTVYHWAHQGYFPHYRPGRLLRVSKKDLLTFLQEERHAGRQA